MAARTHVILVVEDEPILRLAALLMVEEAGYEAVEASNADDAIKILEARADIRIVSTDIHMPGSMDGLKLAAFVRNRWPPIELVIVSAHHDLQADDLPERGVFFTKPYDEGEVIAALTALRHRLLCAGALNNSSGDAEGSRPRSCRPACVFTSPARQQAG